MSLVKDVNAMWYRDLPESEDLEAFAEYVEPKDWKVCREWMEESTDPETGEVYEARWFYFMQRERVGELIHVWNISLPMNTASRYPRVWDHLIEVAEMGWKHFCEEQGIEP